MLPAFLIFEFPANAVVFLQVTQAMEEPKFTSLLRSAKAVEGSPIKLEGKGSGYPAPGKSGNKENEG